MWSFSLGIGIQRKSDSKFFSLRPPLLLAISIQCKESEWNEGKERAQKRSPFGLTLTIPRIMQNRINWKEKTAHFFFTTGLTALQIAGWRHYRAKWDLVLGLTLEKITHNTGCVYRLSIIDRHISVFCSCLVSMCFLSSLTTDELALDTSV